MKIYEKKCKGAWAEVHQAKDKTLRFIYGTGDLMFEFSLWSEVGQMFHPLYKQFRDEHLLETVEISKAPWIASRIKHRKAKG